MKSQVKSKKYNLKYFRIFGKIDYANLKHTDAAKKFQEVTQYSQIKTDDVVVDFGCGRGDFCFYLSQKYRCIVIGIDYSNDAIKLCRSNLKVFSKNQKCKVRIKFYHRNNNHLPVLKNVDYVFLNDVVEHMHDYEIRSVMAVINKWGKNITLLIHTDNLIYLKLIRPFIDIVGAIKGSFTPEYFKSRTIVEKLHINLTYPSLFRNKMNTWGFKQNKLFYPDISDKAIMGQLNLKKSPYIFRCIKTILTKTRFLSPSFYAIYKQK